MRTTWTTGERTGEGERLSVLAVEPAPVTALALQVTLAEVTQGGWVSVVHEQSDHISSSPVDLVITDLLLPTAVEGLRFCQLLKGLLPGVPILVFSAERSASSHSAAVRLGVCAYIHKSASISRLRDAVMRALDGRATWWLGPRSSAMIPPGGALEESDAKEVLSGREREVHSLLIQRFTNAEIAEELCLAEQTVKNYVSTVLKKLGIQSRFEVAGPRSMGAATVTRSEPRPYPRY